MNNFLQTLVKLPLAILLMFLFLRFMGRKQVSQSTPIELVFIIIVANITWDLSLTPDYNIAQSFSLMLVVTVLIYVIDWLTYKFPRLEKGVIGEPITLIKDGEIMEEALKAERMSENELMAMLRVQGVFEIEEVEIAYLEISGQVSVKEKTN